MVENVILVRGLGMLRDTIVVPLQIHVVVIVVIVQRTQVVVDAVVRERAGVVGRSPGGSVVLRDIEIDLQ